MDLGLKDKVVLVTGGTHGIGRAIALTLAAEGCRVAVCSRTPERVEKIRAELEGLGNECLAMVADVTKEPDLARITEAISDRWETIHILVNNVGGGGRWGEEIYEHTNESVWMEVYEKNVLSAIRLTRWAVPYMRKQEWGRVVAITSIFGRESGGPALVLHGQERSDQFYEGHGPGRLSGKSEYHL